MSWKGLGERAEVSKVHMLCLLVQAFGQAKANGRSALAQASFWLSPARAECDGKSRHLFIIYPARALDGDSTRNKSYMMDRDEGGRG
eukprot:9504104-Pyramimonas_sp.AAC.3